MTRFLEDVPERTEDAFGSHRRIADAIAQLIQTPSAAMCIGLSGPWGSGKSTVVALLEAKCTGADCIVWSFDAWAHEGDPLRRTFLESLSRALQEKSWLGAAGTPSAQAWQEELEVLAKRRNVTERRSTPVFSPLALWLALSLLLVPIGLAIFNAQIKSGITLDVRQPIDGLAWLGLVLALAPLPTLILYCLWKLVVSALPGAKRWVLREALTTFVHRQESESRTETVDSGDQTSLEFEATFHRLMAEALGGGAQRRLVLVVDNLDRVGATQALSVWSTLQTFLRQRQPIEEWRNRLWCVLPFDPTAIRRLWEQPGAPASTVAESFLAKTFQVRFEVPLPRLSSWKQYLALRLAQALPGHEADEFVRIYRLYTVLTRGDSWPAPTPRELTLFVNQIASLHRQWQHEIPLTDLAYFVLLSREKQSVTAELLKGSLPAAGVAGLVSTDVRQSLAALAYGASVKESHELLLRQPVVEALTAPAPEKLRELAGVSERFWDVLELVVEEGCAEWPTGEGGLLLHAAAALVQTHTLANQESLRLEPLVRRLARAAHVTKFWAPMDRAAVDGILVLVERDRSLALRLFQAFRSVRTGEMTLPVEDAEGLILDYLRLLSPLADVDVGARTLVLPGPIESYAAAVDTVVRADPEGETWSHVRWFTPDVASALPTSLPMDRWANIARVARAAPDFSFDAWKAVLTAVGSILEECASSDPASSAGRVFAALATVQALARDGGAPRLSAATSRSLTTIALQPLPRAVPEAERDSNAERLRAAAACVYTLLQDDAAWFQNTRATAELSGSPLTDFEQESLKYWIEGDDARAGALAQAVLEIGHVATIFEAARQTPIAAGAMYAAVLELAQRGAPRHVLPLRMLQEDWAGVFSEARRYQLGRALAPNSEFEAALARRPLSPAFVWLYAGAFEAAGASNADFRKRFIELALGIDHAKCQQSLTPTDAADLLCAHIHSTAFADSEGELLYLWRGLFAALEASQRQHVLLSVAFELLRPNPRVQRWLTLVGKETWSEFWSDLEASTVCELARLVISNPAARTGFLELLSINPPPEEALKAAREGLVAGPAARDCA